MQMFSYWWHTIIGIWHSHCQQHIVRHLNWQQGCKKSASALKHSQKKLSHWGCSIFNINTSINCNGISVIWIGYGNNYILEFCMIFLIVVLLCKQRHGKTYKTANLGLCYIWTMEIFSKCFHILDQFLKVMVNWSPKFSSILGST